MINLEPGQENYEDQQFLRNIIFTFELWQIMLKDKKIYNL